MLIHRQNSNIPDKQTLHIFVKFARQDMIIFQSEFQNNHIMVKTVKVKAWQIT